MTQMDFLRAQLRDAISRHGQDAFSTRMLKQQLAALEREPKSALWRERSGESFSQHVDGKTLTV